MLEMFQNAHDSQMNARQSCACDIKIYDFYFFVNLIHVCETHMYLCISFCLFVYKSLDMYLWIIIYLFGITQQFYPHINLINEPLMSGAVTF